MEAEVSFPGGMPRRSSRYRAGRRTGTGSADCRSGTVLFLATVPSVGFAVYDVQAVTEPAVRIHLPLHRSSLPSRTAATE